MAEAAKVELPPRQYEVIYILRPDIDKETSERVAERVAEVIARENGTLTLVENWGRRRLSYEIQHYKRGVYVYNTFLGDGALVAELERNFRLLDEVMRFQTVKISDDPGQVEVDAELIKFEALEASHDDEEDQSLEQELGLIQPPRAPRPDAREREDGDSDADEDSGDEDSEAKGSADEAPAEAVKSEGDES
jgi:small subunit ribosomal protein S6